MKVIYLLVFVLIILLNNYTVYSQTAQCSKAVIGTYEIICSPTQDTYCPENYGDWTQCAPNAYGGKCSTPDADCPNFGRIEPNVPLAVKPSSALIMPSIVYGNTVRPQPENALLGGKLRLYDDNQFLDDGSQNLNYGAIIAQTPFNCPNSTSGQDRCSYPFTVGSSTLGGRRYSYKVDFYSPTLNKYDGPVQQEGATTPRVIIDQLKKFGGGQDFIQDYLHVKGKINIPFRASSEYGVAQNSGINKLYVFLERKDVGTYKPAYPYTVNCLPCIGVDCNLIGLFIVNPPIKSNPGVTTPEASYTFPWDTTICDNADYRFIAKAEDDRETSAAGEPTTPVDIKVDNPTPPDPAPLPTELLNLVFVKIKTWILT